MHITLIAVIVLSAIRFTYLYLLEVAMLFLSLKLVGGRRVKAGPLLLIALSVTGVTAMVEALLAMPPLKAFVASIGVTSMVSLVLSDSPLRAPIPSAIGASYYVARGECTLALLTLTMAPLAMVTSALIDRVAGTGAVALLRGFVLARASGDLQVFEKELSKLTLEERDLTHVLLTLESGEGKGGATLAITDAHPGPIGGIGGALFFERLAEELRRRGYLPLMLRGLGGHDNDVVSSKVVSSLLDKMLSELTSRNPHCSCEPTLGQASDEHARVLLFSLCEKSISFVIRKKPSFDDLPFSLRKLQDDLGVVLIDAHSYYGEWRDDPQELTERLKRLLKEALARRRPCGSLRFGISNVPGRLIDRRGIEIGSLGLATLVIECAESKIGILLFDGNSMVPGLRDMLEKELIGLVNDVVIATTDNHAVVRIRSRWGYNPIGSSLSWSMIAETASASIRKALESLTPACVSFVSLTTRAPVLGERGVGSLEKALARVPHAALILVANVILLPLVLAIIIT